MEQITQQPRSCFCWKIWLFLLISCSAHQVMAEPESNDSDMQESTPNKPEGEFTARTIVITPEGQPVDPQQTPKTVNYFSGQELDRSGINNTIDLQYKTPGFILKTNALLGQPYLRGVGSDIISAGAEASVATFVDGIYLPRAFDSIVDFYDLERVEVIKGPQGVYLGRNVVGGAVSIHTRDPQPYKTAYADILYGSYNKRQLRSAVNLPITGSTLVFRLAGTATRRDGYSQNIYLHEDADDENYYAMRGKLLYIPTENLRLLLTASHSSEDSSRAIAPQPDPHHGVNGGIALGGIVPENPRELTSNVSPNLNVQSNRYSARLNWKYEHFEFISTTAWVDTQGKLAMDLDGTNVNFSANYPKADSNAFMQELRLLSATQKNLSWITGLFLFNEEAEQMLDVRLPLNGVKSVPDGTVGTLSYATFGQLTWRFFPGWRSKVGIRYSHDRRKLDLVKTVSKSTGTTITTQDAEKSWRALTPEFTLEYSPHSNKFYYITASRGYKAGGFNTSSIQPAFDSEYLWAYEAGIKSTLPKQHLLLDVALFYYDYDNMQLRTPPRNAPVGTYPIVINAAKSIIKGLDLEARFQPMWNLGFSLAATLLNAKFADFVSVDPNNPGDNPDRSGNPLPQAPDISLNLATDYSWLLNNGKLTFDAEYRYQSSVYFNIYTDPEVKQNSYGLVNMSLDFESRNGRWYANLYGRNLTNKLYAQTINRSDPLYGIKRYWGAPRTIGLRLGYRL
ncbi:MAG TPA: TonB-dependent receptor [Gammaproteobacteria bacterium]|nr:TonB-dependent receptor [Gammaproteobacteria bacterium]